MEIVPEPVRHTKRYNKYLTNLIFSFLYCMLRILAFSPTIYGPRTSRLGHKSKGKKLGT